jgi:SAM-dependent methyltransferase
MRTLLKRMVPRPVRRWIRETQMSVSRTVSPLLPGVDMGDLRRVTPIARNFGLQRGNPIDRHYIEGFLAEHAQQIRGRVLEVQTDDYTRLFGGKGVTRADVVDIDAANTCATLVADLAVPCSLPSETFDCIICTQTLLLIYDVKTAVMNLYRALKREGVLLATVPGVAHKIETNERHDFWRFTSQSARRMFAEVFGDGNVEVRAYGNVLAATAFLHGMVTREFTRGELDHHDPEYEVTIAVRAVKQ